MPAQESAHVWMYIHEAPEQSRHTYSGREVTVVADSSGVEREETFLGKSDNNLCHTRYVFAQTAHLEAEEMVQLANFLLHDPEDLSLEPQNSHQKPGTAVQACNSFLFDIFIIS